MAKLSHGQGKDGRNEMVKADHRDATDPGHKTKVELGTTTACAPKYGVNVTGGAAKYGFNYPGAPNKGHNGFPGYPVPTKRS